MDVILLQKVKNLGNLGDKVRVKPGYSRNFLIPYGKAVPATAANLAQFETSRAEFEARANEVLAAALARKSKLEGASVTIKANASTEGKLYGSVGPREIAEAFTTAGMPLEKAEVIMGEGPLRKVGDNDVEVHLHADVHMTVKVIIIPEA